MLPPCRTFHFCSPTERGLIKATITELFRTSFLSQLLDSPIIMGDHHKHFSNTFQSLNNSQLFLCFVCCLFIHKYRSNLTHILYTIQLIHFCPVDTPQQWSFLHVKFLLHFKLTNSGHPQSQHISPLACWQGSCSIVLLTTR